MTKVSFVSQWYPPEPVVVPPAIVRALVNQGLDMRVLTGVPNYPDGRVAEGYRASRSRLDIVDGVSVHRVPLYPSHDGSAIRRFGNYASFAASSGILGWRALRDADVALVYSSPATAVTAPLAAGLARSLPYVLYVQDVWPDSVFASGYLQHGWSHVAADVSLTAFCACSYRRADSIAVISPGMRRLLVHRGVPEHKIRLVYNWADERAMRPVAPDPGLRDRLGIGDAMLLMYAGNLGSAQDLETAINAMTRLRDLDVHLVLVGSGVQREHLRHRAGAMGLTTVHFLDHVPVRQVAALMWAADVQLVSLANRPLFHITMPSKVQAILAAGRPILASAPGDTAALVEAAGAGFGMAAGDATALATGVRRMHAVGRHGRERMGAAGMAYYRRELSEQVGAARLAEALQLAARSRAANGRVRTRGR